MTESHPARTTAISGQPNRLAPQIAWLRRPAGPAPAVRIWLPVAGIAVAILVAALLLDSASVGWARDLPHWFTRFGEIGSRIGQSEWYLVPTGVLALLLFLGDWRRTSESLRAGWATIGAMSAYAFFAVGGGAIVVNILKIIFGRGRPLMFDELGWLTIHPFTSGYSFASFPSGHSTTAGAVIVVGWLLLPRLRVLFVAFAIAIPVSRILVGAHYPSDVIAGLSVGAGVAYFSARFLARRRIAFIIDGAGHIRPKAQLISASVRKAGLGAFVAAPFRALVR